jgi:hypothetical protein
MRNYNSLLFLHRKAKGLVQNFTPEIVILAESGASYHSHFLGVIVGGCIIRSSWWDKLEFAKVCNGFQMTGTSITESINSQQLLGFLGQGEQFGCGTMHPVCCIFVACCLVLLLSLSKAFLFLKEVGLEEGAVLALYLEQLESDAQKQRLLFRR